MVVGLTASQYLVQEDGKGGRLMPGQIVRYPKVYKHYYEFHKIWFLCRMPIMTFPKGSHTTSSDSQSLRHSSKITTSCPALLTLSWCMSWSKCPGTWLWTFRQLKSSRGMPGLHSRPQWRLLPSGFRILRLFSELYWLIFHILFFPAPFEKIWGTVWPDILTYSSTKCWTSWNWAPCSSIQTSGWVFPETAGCC